MIYYYQGLLKEICRLPHSSEIFEYFINKIYVNYFEMNIHQLREKTKKFIINPLTRHFLAIYVYMHDDLS